MKVSKVTKEVCWKIPSVSALDIKHSIHNLTYLLYNTTLQNKLMWKARREGTVHFVLCVRRLTCKAECLGLCMSSNSPVLFSGFVGLYGTEAVG